MTPARPNADKTPPQAAKPAEGSEQAKPDESAPSPAPTVAPPREPSRIEPAEPGAIQLTPEEAALLEDQISAVAAVEEAPEVPSDILSRVTRRLMRGRDHRDRCPGISADGVGVNDSARVEAYDQAIPATARQDNPLGKPGGLCTVVRCLECGEMRLMPGTRAENLRTIASTAALSG